MRFLSIVPLCAFALVAGASEPNRFSLVRSDSGEADGDAAGFAVFSLDESAIRLACVEEPADVPAGVQPAVAVLCHGFGGSKESPLFDALSKALRKRGVSVARFDFNGHGESEGAFRDMTVSNEVLDAKTVVDFYRDVRNARVALVGHSQGGVVAALAASELGAENVEALVLLAPAAVLREDALRGRIFDAVFDPLDPPETVPVLGGSLEIGRDYVLGAQRTDPYPAVASYAGPLLVLHGRGDTVVPWTCGERFVSGRLGNGRFTLLPTADHAFTGVEKAVAEEVAQFVAACFHAGSAEDETHAEAAEVAEAPAPAVEEEHAEIAEAPAPAAEEEHAESAEDPAPAVEEEHAEAAEIAEAPAPAAEEEHAEAAEIAEAPAPAAEEEHAEAAEIAEAPAPAAEEEHAETAEVAEAPAPAVPAAEVGGGSGEAEPPPVVVEAPAPAEAAPVEETPADEGGEAALIQSTAAAEPPAVDSVESLAAAYPVQPVDSSASVVNILAAPNGFTWEGFEVPEADLLDRIRILGQTAPASVVRIQAFRETPVETLKEILSALKAAGIAGVSVQLPAVSSVVPAH